MSTGCRVFWINVDYYVEGRGGIPRGDVGGLLCVRCLW